MTNEFTLEMDWPELIKKLFELVLPQSDDILRSPAKLGDLLNICAEFAEIDPVIGERAGTLAMQNRDGNRYVEAHHIVELCLCCPLANLQRLMTDLAMQLGNVSETRYRLSCQSDGLQPANDAVKHSDATVFLRCISTNNQER
jgi:hypothetical protein